MDYEKNLNYIRYLNGLYSIRKIIIYNEGDEPAKDLKLGLTFTPEFAQSWVRGLQEASMWRFPDRRLFLNKLFR